VGHEAEAMRDYSAAVAAMSLERSSDRGETNGRASAPSSTDGSGASDDAPTPPEGDAPTA
jgi:hypothetical protein